jgi:hypothetical protein
MFKKLNKLYVCATQRHLLDALIDVARDVNNYHCIILLSDHQEFAVNHCHLNSINNLQILISTDDVAIQEFSLLSLGALKKNRYIRKIFINFSLKNFKIIRPTKFKPSLLRDLAFDVGVIYHPKIFMSKCVRSVCARLVLREDGFVNLYPKASFFPRFHVNHYFYGSESWIDELQMTSCPTKSLKYKYFRRSLGEELAKMSPSEKQLICDAWSFTMPLISPVKKKCLLLGLDLSRSGTLSKEMADSLMSDIINKLNEGGYEVIYKAHPKDRKIDFQSVISLPKSIPSELIPYLINENFDALIDFSSSSQLSEAFMQSVIFKSLITAEEMNMVLRSSQNWKVIKLRIFERLADLTRGDA